MVGHNKKPPTGKQPYVCAAVMGGQTSSMAHNTRFQRPVYKDLLSFALDEQPVAYDEQRPLFVDAENPALSLNARQVRVFVRTVIAGLRKRAGVETGDCVLVTLPNNVSLSFVLRRYYTG